MRGISGWLSVGTPRLFDQFNQLITGAGDQGMMFGYASNETAELMPAPIAYAHRLAKRLADVRHDGTLPFIRPDGKTQVSFDYRDGKPTEINTVLISTQHDPDVSQKEIQDALVAEVIEKSIPESLRAEKIRYLVNPTGRFVVGGPAGDAGLTGRKIIVDTYGGMGRHGGGAFSGKDPSKVDRSACYFARYIAKNVVSAGLADRCEVQLSYAIGVAEPISIMIDAFGTAQVDEAKIVEAIRAEFSAKPANIIERLQLKRPMYQKTAAYGHFGQPGADFSWERTDAAQALADHVGLGLKAARAS